MARQALNASLPRNHSRRPSWESPSLLSADSPAEVVLSASAPTSMRRPAQFSEASSRTSSVTQLPTLNTPKERLSLLSMSYTPSRDKAEPSTASVDEHSLLCFKFFVNVKPKICFSLYF